MTDLDIIDRAKACCARLPERDVSPKTLRAYRATFKRMLHEPELDPLKPGIARDTYNHRRAALHTAGRWLLARLIEGFVAATGRNDLAAAKKCIAGLVSVLDRIEPALERDPPLPPGALSWEMPASRWKQMDAPRPRRGKNSKQQVLAFLPDDWRERLWKATPKDWRYRSALAVHMLVGCRPEELMPGHRPHGPSPGVEIKLPSPRVLEITIAPVKTHGEKYGTPTTTIKMDPTLEGGPAVHLAELCAAAGGRTVVSISSKNAMRKALERLGRRAMPEVRIAITPYVLRHQALADLKATVGGGAEVAAAAGHCTDRTQARYGYVGHGKKRKGYLGVVSAKAPRVGNVERGHEIAAARRPKSSFER